MTHVATTLSADALVTLPTPQATDTWTPLPHRDARDILWTALNAAGLEPSNERITAWEGDRKNQRGVLTDATGQFDLNAVRSDGRRIQAAWINDHRKFRGYTLALGEQVFICSNGCVFAESVVKTRRTSRVDDRINDFADRFAAEIGALAARNDERREAYARRFLCPDAMRATVVRMAENDIIGSAKILPILAEVEEPSFAYEHDRGSLLNLQSATTHIMKGYTPMSQHDRTLRLTRFLDDLVTA